MIDNYKKNALIILLLCFCSIGLNAQTIKFQKVYGGYSYDYGNDLIQMDDTGYVLLCTSSSLTGNAQVYLLKVDKYGNYVWHRDYGGSEVEGAAEIKHTNDGNLIMNGFTSSFGNGSYDFYLLKTDYNGDLIWSYNYGGTDWDFSYSMDTCADGGYIMAGKTYSNGSATSDILIIKVDANGTQQWSKTYGGNKDDVANSIITLTDGYAVCGTTATGTLGMNDIYVFKIDLNGDTLWTRCFGDTLNDEGTDIVFNPADTSLIVSGNITLPNIPGNFNTFFMKIKPNGNNVWGGYNTSIDHWPDNAKSVIIGHNTRIATCGSFDSGLTGYMDAYVYYYNSLGSYIQGGDLGGSNEDSGENVIKTLDYSYALIGTTNSFVTGLSNIYFIKTDTILPSECPIYISVNTTEIHSPKEKINAAVYPNPFSQNTTININEPAIVLYQKVQLLVWNNLGQEVSTQVNTKLLHNGNQSTLQLNNISLQNGIYHYQIIVGNKVLNTGNFTVLKNE